ncbi:hypothetical protein BKA57DRAFT_449543 [Linnemannia elongata]|nr:hypothetical protein BKA57DRAFT_449543 [Linnemannia elongata]
MHPPTLTFFSASSCSLPRCYTTPTPTPIRLCTVQTLLFILIELLHYCLMLGSWLVLCKSLMTLHSMDSRLLVFAWTIFFLVNGFL